MDPETEVTIPRKEYEDLAERVRAGKVLAEEAERQETVRALVTAAGRRARMGKIPVGPAVKPRRDLTPEDKAAAAERKKKRKASKDARKRNRGVR